jgi:hypothetical protein
MEPEMTEISKPDADKRIEILLDGDPLLIPDKKISPNEILKIAGLDPFTHYLVQVEKREQISYQGKGEEPIKVHKGDVFVSLSTEPTPTS